MIPAPTRRDDAVAARVEATGIDEAMIERLVHRFYGDVRTDALIGPMFNARVADWDAHLAKLCDFWSSVALMTGRYNGKPMQVHLNLPLDASHFERWMALFRRAAADTCPPEAAEFLIDRAARISESIQLGIAFTRGGGLLTGARAPLRPVSSPA
jgi:hemoglobin